MAPEVKELKIGDRCPIDGGEMKPDPKHDTDRLISAHRSVAHDQRAHENYARQLRAKVDDAGVIYSCVTCGYSARLKDTSAKGGRARGGAGNRNSGASGGDRDDNQGAETNQGA